MNNNWDSGIFALLNHSSTIIHTTPYRIDNSIKAQPIFLSLRPPIINTSYKDGNVQNNILINNDSDYFTESKNRNNLHFDVYENLKSENYQKDLDSLSINPMQTVLNKRRKFSPEEDIQLRKLIEIQGPKKWDQIALSMPGRTGRQCRDRFNNYLDPSLTNGPWTLEEDILLEQKVYEIGQHWNIIAKFFKGRSANNIKNRWYTYICCEKKSQSQKLLNQTNIKKCQPIEIKSSDNINNNFVSNLTNYNSSKNFNQNNFKINYSNNSFIPMIALNTSCTHKNISIDNFNNFDELSKKTKNEKKIFYPPLIKPDGNIILI